MTHHLWHPPRSQATSHHSQAVPPIHPPSPPIHLYRHEFQPHMIPTSSTHSPTTMPLCAIAPQQHREERRRRWLRDKGRLKEQQGVNPAAPLCSGTWEWRRRGKRMRRHRSIACRLEFIGVGVAAFLCVLVLFSAPRQSSGLEIADGTGGVDSATVCVVLKFQNFNF